MPKIMKKFHIQFLFFLVYLKAIQTSSLRCNGENRDCLCLPSKNSLEFHCPPDLDSNFDGIVTKITEDTITIDCYNMPTFNISYLPIYDIREIKKIKIQLCPLSPNGFTEVLNKFNVTKLEAFVFHLSNFSEVTLSKDYFTGFESLKSLSLNSNNMINIDRNVFENTPNLESLDLKLNRIDLKTGIFDYTPNLQWLDVSSNSLNTIPDGLFANLAKLEYLYLYSNNIEELQETVFSGLNNLKVLEMSMNKIQNIHEKVFTYTPKLVNVSFNNNKLKYISGKLYSEREYLSHIRMAYNPKLKLSDFAFANLTNLISVELFTCEIDELPNNLFENSTNLEIIKLDKNSLSALPRTVFKNLNKLSQLYLNSNKIKSVYKETFQDLKGLQILHLHDNNFEKISSDAFEYLHNLEELDLNSNNIKVIKSVLDDFNKLKRLNLSYNFIEFEEENPFHNLHSLEFLDLSHNNLEDFNVDTYLRTAQNIRTLDLSYNNFTILLMDNLMPIFNHKVEVNMSNNKITEVSYGYDYCMSDFLKFQKENLESLNQPGEASMVSVNLSNNPMKCNCFAYNLVSYFHDLIDPRIKTVIHLKEDNLFCDGPEPLKGKRVSDLSLKELMCPFSEFNVNCSDKCDCFYRPYNDTTIADCSSRNLTVLPELSFDNCINIPRLTCKPACFNQTKQEVHLENNLLQTAPTEYDIGYKNVTRLYLSNNLIRNISWAPKKVSYLYLGNNLIEKLDYQLLNFLNSSQYLEELTLDNNPWDCNCSAWNFTLFLRYNYRKVNTDGVVCAANNVVLLEIPDDDLLCPTHTISILVSCVIVIGTLLIAATILALYWRYSQEIKIWLFAHNLCLWLVTEEELDKDKLYDAFISYSHKDEDFLAANLLPVLEKEPNPYKLCIHVRDFVPGLTINEQIAHSVKNSRRTIIILSKNFLNSIWARLEFQLAHLQALEDGMSRVIIILYGDVDVDTLDEDLKVYLKTNTYVKWGDKWFWDKLKYALPHSNKRVQKSDRKHANIMMTLDEKYRFGTEENGVELTPNEGTTPPLTTLDAASLKKHPLSFKAGEINISNIENGGLKPLVTK